MRISLLSNGVIYPLAGEAGVAESVHSSAGDFEIDPGIEKQTVKRVRAETALTWDRGNLLSTLSFSTWRTFSTVAAAEKYALDYDRLMPRTGVLIMATTGGGGYPDFILVHGDLTTDGSTPAVFQQLDYDGPVSGRPSYTAATGGANVQWTGTAWLLAHDGDVPLFSSTNDVASPDLVTAWTPVGAADGIPALIGCYEDSRYLSGVVLDPPVRRVLGCSVTLRYTATGGEPSPTLTLT